MQESKNAQRTHPPLSTRTLLRHTKGRSQKKITAGFPMILNFQVTLPQPPQNHSSSDDRIFSYALPPKLY